MSTNAHSIQTSNVEVCEDPLTMANEDLQMCILDSITLPENRISFLK